MNLLTNVSQGHSRQECNVERTLRHDKRRDGTPVRMIHPSIVIFFSDGRQKQRKKKEKKKKKVWR